MEIWLHKLKGKSVLYKTVVSSFHVCHHVNLIDPLGFHVQQKASWVCVMRQFCSPFTSCSMKAHTDYISAKRTFITLTQGLCLTIYIRHSVLCKIRTNFFSFSRKEHIWLFHYEIESSVTLFTKTAKSLKEFGTEHFLQGKKCIDILVDIQKSNVSIKNRLLTA